MQCRRIFFTISVTFCLIAFLSSLAGAQAPADNSQKNPFAGDAEAITVGKAIYVAACAGYCHASEGSRRQGRCPNLFDCEWKHGSSDDEVFHSVSAGVPRTEMVGFKGKLPDEILWKVIAYLRSVSQCPSAKPTAAAAH